MLCWVVSLPVAAESTKKSRDFDPFHHFVDFLVGKSELGKRPRTECTCSGRMPGGDTERPFGLTARLLRVDSSGSAMCAAPRPAGNAEAKTCCRTRSMVHSDTYSVEPHRRDGTGVLGRVRFGVGPVKLDVCFR